MKTPKSSRVSTGVATYQNQNESNHCTLSESLGHFGAGAWEQKILGEKPGRKALAVSAVETSPKGPAGVAQIRTSPNSARP